LESRIFKLTELIVASCFLVLTAVGQQVLDPSLSVPKIPSDFTVDIQTAARLRPQFMEQSVPATGRYAEGRLVLDRLIANASAPAGIRLEWELRIVEDGQLNAYSSPDGTIFVESGLAQLAGTSAGLWAAILSHEIAHVIRRDWARRYLYQKSLESSSSAAIVLGDPGMPFSSWADSGKASEQMGEFCRRMEVEADREGLMLMARAGYHPDFVPALHHLLRAQDADAKAAEHAMHPCWEERDQELMSAYVAASIEFEHRWLEWYASPGGNPPIVVFTESPTVRKTGSKEWQIQIPIRCENLAGAVEVVLRAGYAPGKAADSEHLDDQSDSGYEVRQLTGCTSPRATVTLTLTDRSTRSKPGRPWANIYVLDAWGAVLGRAEVPKLPH